MVRTRIKRKTRHKTSHRKSRKHIRNKRRNSRRHVMRGGIPVNSEDKLLYTWKIGYMTSPINAKVIKTREPDAIYMLNISGLPGDSKVFNPELFEEHAYEQVPGYTGDFIKVIKEKYIQFCNYIDQNKLIDLKDLTLSEFFNKEKEDIVNWYRDNIENKIKEFNNENPIIEIDVEKEGIR